MNLHHIVVISVYLQVFYYNNSASENLLGLFAGELTNPFNIIRQVFDLWGEKRKSGKASMIFAVLFLPLRGIVIPAICMEIQYNPNLSYVLKVPSVVIGRSRLL